MKKKKKNTIYNVIAYIYVALNLLFLGLIYYVDMLPTKYFLPIFLVIIIFTGVISYFLFRRKTKKGKKIGLSILAVFLSIILVFANYYIIKGLGIKRNMNENSNYKNYSVMVLKNSKYKKITDLNGSSIGYFKNDPDNDEVISKLANEAKLSFNEYDDLQLLALDLLDKKIDGLLIEDSYVSLLKDSGEIKNERLNDFDKLTKVIYTLKIEKKVAEIKKDVNVREEPFSVYISGIDTYGEVTSVSRSDVNIIATINPTTNQILLTTIPRDYYVKLDGTTGYKDKLTHAGMYGIDTSVKTIENLLDIDINYYVKVNFTSLIDIVDSLGGVEVNSDYSFYTVDGVSFNKGINYVDGKKALSFARERHSFIDGDRQRGKNQVALIEAIFKKCITPSILIKYNDFLNSLDGSFVTNMSMGKLTSLIKKQIDDNASWNISSVSLNGSDAQEYTYSYSAEKLYVMIPDENSVNEAKAQIKNIINGTK